MVTVARSSFESIASSLILRLMVPSGGMPLLVVASSDYSAGRLGHQAITVRRFGAEPRVQTLINR